MVDRDSVRKYGDFEGVERKCRIDVKLYRRRPPPLFLSVTKNKYYEIWCISAIKYGNFEGVERKFMSNYLKDARPPPLLFLSVTKNKYYDIWWRSFTLIIFSDDKGSHQQIDPKKIGEKNQDIATGFIRVCMSNNIQCRWWCVPRNAIAGPVGESSYHRLGYWT